MTGILEEHIDETRARFARIRTYCEEIDSVHGLDEFCNDIIDMLGDQEAR